MKLRLRPGVPLPELPSEMHDAREALGRPVDAGLLEALQSAPGRPEGAIKREALARGQAVAVVTGQQPCFPLPLGLTLFKAATAVALAARESRRLGVQVAPIFWSAGDDSDFQEARGQWLPRPGRAPLKVSLQAACERRGAFVGDLPLAQAYGELLALKGLGDGAALWAPRSGEDLGARECRILAELFAPWGLLCLDARAAGLRQASRELFERYARKRGEFAAAIEDQGARLEREGGARPLRPDIGSRALFFLRGRRRSLPRAADYGERLAERLATQPDSLSPNAALRPLIQDALLPVCAAVLGPGEWAYHRQLLPAFAVMELAFPAAVPRLALAAEGWAPGADPWRGSSPLALAGHPLGDPILLVALAMEHLVHWDEGRTGELVWEGEAP